MNECEVRLAKLKGEGWTRRFVASEPRLSEVCEMYREAGFEVHLEPLSTETECTNCSEPENTKECRICFEGFEDQYRIIFTRPTKFLL
jgi:hypothetical protein